jgi:hypothetical protein
LPLALSADFDMALRQSRFPRKAEKIYHGGAGLVLGLAILVFSEMKSVNSRAFLFVIFWVAGLGIFQAKEKT